MRLLIAVMLAFAVAAVGSVGCTKKTSDVAKPKEKEKEKEGGASTKAEDSFTLTADPAEKNLKQGEKADVKISITRGKNFKEDTEITVKVKGDKDVVTASTKSEKVGKGDSSFAVALTAAESAAVDANYTVTVTAEGGGKEATVDIKGKILKK